MKQIRQRRRRIRRRVRVVGIAVLAAMAWGANPIANANSSDFLGAAQAAGVTGAAPAMLEDGYQVCRRLWVRHMEGTQIANGLVQDHPQLTFDQAAQFVLAAYRDLCPVPGGSFDYWAYSTG